MTVEPYVAPMGLATQFIEADAAWHAELERRFGDNADAAQYQKRGRGSFGDRLSILWIARDKARLAWEGRP